MELKKFPAYPEAFINYRQYNQEREQFHREAHVGSIVQFNCDLIGVSGAVLHRKGDVVRVRDMDVECFKVETLSGDPIYGLFKPSCFNPTWNAVILLDEPAGRHFATWVEKQKKTIETRMRDIIPDGDIIICCSSGSMTANRCKALCIVHVAKGRPMTPEDEPAAGIECVPGRISYELSNWRYFSRKFLFSRRKVSGTFQGIFVISIPEDVDILPAAFRTVMP